MNEDIRKKEKKIDKNHWMARIQKFSFNIDAESFYMGYCPFFWMTWLALFCAPFVAFGKKVNSIIFKPLNEYTYKKQKIVKQRRSETPLQPSDYKLLKWFYSAKCFQEELTQEKIFEYLKDDWEWRLINELEYNRYKLWFEKNPNWTETYLVAARKNEEINKKKQEEREQKQIKKKQKMRRIANRCAVFGSILVKILIPTAILSAIFGCYKLTQIITISHVSSMLTAVCVISFFIAVILILKIVGSFFAIFVGETVLDIVDNLEEKDFTWLSKIKNAIKTTVSFVIETIKLTYKRECPMIIWGNETGKIEKRNK